ncbi:MAG: hypothetical protein OIN88_05765 [Candidatus Methanoperedens sp.]|nr:hypothetical protein [Candidatus Methanoperedens sp.]
MKNTIFQKQDGVSPVLGAILMLAVGVTLLTTIQLSFVPVWNAQEELEHLKKMYDDFKELKSGIESSVQSGTVLSKPLIMGFKYSPKMFVYNPKESAYASLDIQENTWAEIRYNELLSEGMDDATSKKNISSSTMTYSLQGTKNYSSFVYEHGLIRRSGSNYTPSPQIVMANSSIYLLSLRPLGTETSAGVERRTVNIYPTSQQKNSVIGKNVWLILHTKPEYVYWWKSSIEKEGGNVKKADRDNGTVIAQMNSTVIKLGEAYLSTSPKAAPSHAPPYRLVKAVQDNINLPVDGIINLAVEVQDKYNNPVPNVQVNFDINNTRKPGNSNSPTAIILQNPAVSGADGRANVILKTGGAGFYYIDASLADPSDKTTFAYPASSQGGVLSLACQAPCTGTESEYTIRATLKDGLGTLVNGSTIDFDKSDDGSTLNPNSGTTVSGNSSTVLNITGGKGIRITNIQTVDVTDNTSRITWDTLNNITVTAKSGFVFNSINIPTKVNTSGCVRYGTSAGNYNLMECDNITNAYSHSVNLSNLLPYTAYYFIVNSSRLDGSGMESTEYMFVTDKIRDDGIPPASVTDLNNATGALYIKWTWTDPADLDFDHVEIYIDGVPRGTVSKGMQFFNATYFQPGTSHAISTRAVDEFGRVSTWNNQSASTQSLFTYVFSFAKANGTVTLPDSARNATDGLSAILTEEMVGGVNASDRPVNPGKSITTGAQSGTYDPTSPNVALDSKIDVTSPEKQIKTVVYYMGQRESISDLAPGNSFSGPPVSVYLPENGITVRKAWLELWQLSGTQAAGSVTTINMYLNGVDYSVINGGTYQQQTGETLVTVARANVTPAFALFTNPTTFTAAVNTLGANTNAQALLLYITYEYDPNSPTQLKTVRYPLDTVTSARAAGSTTNFNYYVEVPENPTIRSSWFELRGKVDSASTNDVLINARIATNATFSNGVNLDMALRDKYEFFYLFKTTPEFSPNAAQTLIVQNQNQAVYTMGGEIVVTYEYSNSELVQLKTVKYFLGQRTTSGAIGLLSDSTTVFIPEQGIAVKNIWARVRSTSYGGGTQTVGGSIGGTSTTSQTYNLNPVGLELIRDNTIIYNMTSAASSLVNDTLIFVNNLFSSASHGPPGTELYITYTYDPASPVELKTVEYPAGQSPRQVSPWNDNFDIIVPEVEALRRSAYIDYMTMSSSTAATYDTVSAIDTSFSAQTATIGTTGEALTSGILNGDIQNRITAAGNSYSLNFSSSTAASFSGVAKLTYEFRKGNSVDADYTFTGANPNTTWQSIRIMDSSYADSLAKVSIFNAAAGQWEPLSLRNAFTGGSMPAEHVNTTVGNSGNASDYDSGSGQIKIRFNWTGGSASSNLGVDLLNVTINYLSGGAFRLNITSNTTDIPETSNPNNHELQVRYNVSGDNFTLQIWNGATWSNKTILSNRSPDYYNVTLLPSELQLYENTTGGTVGNINKYFVLVRYLDKTADLVRNRLYLDYQRVYSW